MPFQKVHGSWFMVHGNRKAANQLPSTNYQLPTINKRQRRFGFTLTELLVVITILGILASFTSIALIGHQKKARDAQRKSDLATFKKAMESAKNDCRNSAYYPRAAPLTGEATKFLQTDIYLNALKYIPTSIQDPKHTPGSTYVYRLAITNSLGLHCPNQSTSVANASPGTNAWVARARLENGNKDPDRVKSYNVCSSKVSLMPAGAFTDGLPSDTDDFFYVCSE